MQVRPQYLAVDPLRDVQHVVMVGPVDADHDEAQDIGQESRQDRAKRSPVRSGWNFQLEDHNGDQDGDHAVAEGLKTSLTHSGGTSSCKSRDGRLDPVSVPLTTDTT